MYKQLKKHFWYYSSFVLTLTLALVLIVLANPNLKLQSLVIIITVFFYILSGTLHHYVNHELTSKIMVEYVLIGLLGVAIIFFVIMGGL